MVIELGNVKKYLEDQMKIELKFDLRTETINVEIFLGDDLICDSSVSLPKPKVSWS